MTSPISLPSYLSAIGSWSNECLILSCVFGNGRDGLKIRDNT